MTDIGINANALAIMAVLCMIASAFVGAAFAFGIVERRERKAKAAASKPKHTPLNLTV